MTFDAVDDPREGGAKGPDAFRTISEVAEELGLPQHVLRFWETRFPQIRPIKRGGGRRYYRPGDVELLRGVKELLYGQGYTIRGVQRILREQGGRKLAQTAGASAPAPRPAEPDFYAPRRDASPEDLFDDADRSGENERVENRPAEIDAPRERTFSFEPPPMQKRAAEPAPRVDSVNITPSQPGLSETQSRRLASALEELNACRRLLGGLA